MGRRKSKAEPKAKDPHNIVNIDLPHYSAQGGGRRKIQDTPTTTSMLVRIARVIRIRARDFTLTCRAKSIMGEYHRKGFTRGCGCPPFGLGQGGWPPREDVRGRSQERLARCARGGASFGSLDCTTIRAKTCRSLLYHNAGRPEVWDARRGCGRFRTGNDNDVEKSGDRSDGRKPFTSPTAYRYTTRWVRRAGGEKTAEAWPESSG